MKNVVSVQRAFRTLGQCFVVTGLLFYGAACMADDSGRKPSSSKAINSAARAGAAAYGSYQAGSAVGNVAGNAAKNAKDNGDAAVANRKNQDAENFDRIKNRPKEAKARVDAAKYGGYQCPSGMSSCAGAAK